VICGQCGSDSPSRVPADDDADGLRAALDAVPPSCPACGATPFGAVPDVRARVEALLPADLTPAPGHWRHLDPAALTAAGLLRITAAEQVALQLRVWQELLRDWTDVDSPEAPGTSFADDLRTYVSGSSVPESERDGLAEIFDADGFLPYATAALRSRVAREIDLPDPGADGWAELWLRYEIRYARHRSPRARALRVPPAETGIAHPAAWTAVRRLLEPMLGDRPGGDGLFEQVSRAAADLGYAGLARAVVQASAIGARGADGTIGDARRIAELAASGVDLDAALAAAHRLTEAQPPERRGDLVDEVAARLVEVFPDRTGAVLAWQARRHTADGRLDAAVRVLDAGPRDQPLAVRARMLGARADVHSGRGETAEATALWRRIAALVEHEPDRTQWYWARINLAFLIEDRDPEEAALLLADAAWGPDQYGPDSDVVAHLAVLAARRGDLTQAIDLLADAVRLANGQPLVVRRYAAQRARLLLAAGREEEAIAALPPLDGPVTVDEAITWAALARSTRGAIPDAVRRLPAAFTARAVAARATGDLVTHHRLLAAATEVQEILTGAIRGYDALVTGREHDGIDIPPRELVQAARVRQAAGDTDGMRRRLSAVPAVLAARYGSTLDLDLVVRQPGELLRPLALLGGEVSDIDDLRLVGELQRDTIGRARTAQRDAAVAAVPAAAWDGRVDGRWAAGGPITVVEWVLTGERSARCLLTRMAAGTVTSAGIDPGAADPIQVQNELISRLHAWQHGAPDPFALPGWRELADHLMAALDRYAQPGDHVVLLYQQHWANLPWHVAVQRRWSVSYASGWSHLREFLARPPAPRRRLGVLLAPSAGDAPQAVAALRQAHDRLAAEPAASMTTDDPARADRSFLTGLLGGTDIAVLLCHGYRGERGLDVGVAVAADGRLPSQQPAEASRFGWRDALRLSAAPRTVLTAACSTAYGYGAGLGDRLGLGTALRIAGATALVAPFWDVLAVDALAVLTETTVRHLAGMPLAEALRSAADDITPTGPDWTVRALAIEGDFR
jgi:hypothetical protein